ncbi:unnamed protein product [Durusdinium trenchii]|uniref:Uncharacterized protein n=1 Tax=Durusdinium trenchii TaxID=1381693 RepID=A0ABP0LI86_9DINO
MKFFALILTSSFSSALAVAAGKAKSATGGLLADDKPTNPWLSLLTKSWALPGESQEEQSKGLDGLASSILALAKNHKSGAPDEEMKAAVESISQILTDMKDSVTTGNAAAQQEINKKQSAVKNCSVPAETSMPDFEATLHLGVKDVLDCRADEKSYYDAYQHCLSEEARCANTTECCVDLIQPNPYCLSPPSPPSPLTFQSECDTARKSYVASSRWAWYCCVWLAGATLMDNAIFHHIQPFEKQRTSSSGHRRLCGRTVLVQPRPQHLPRSRSKCREKDLDNKLAFFELKLQEYNEASYACEQSRLGCNSSYTCQLKQEAWKEKHALCNSNQSAFEQAYCDLAGTQEAHWDTYSSCHARSVQALEAEEVKQESLLLGRRQEWRGLLRIECLLGALTAADQAAALDACINKNQTTIAAEALNLTYPTKVGAVPTKSSCSEKLNAPGTSYFLKTFYSGVPEVLMPTSLTTYYCVSGLSTSYCPVASTTLSLLTKVQQNHLPVVPHIM